MTFKPQIPGTVLCFAHSQFLVFYYYCFGFTTSEIQTYCYMLFFFYRPTAQHMIILIEHCRLSRCHGTLRFVKLRQQGTVRLRIQRTRCSRMGITDFTDCPDRLCQFFLRHIIDIIHMTVTRKQAFGLAKHDFVCLRTKFLDKIGVDEEMPRPLRCPIV